jgi:uncharacterized protein DUF5655
LWRCPECRRVFANRNQTHSCAPLFTLSHHVRGKPPLVRAICRRVIAAVRRIGRVRVLPEKTRIAFQVRMSFAQITPRRRWVDGHVVLARRLEHPRFRRVQTFSPGNHVHEFRLTRLDDVDADFRAWLAEAYLVGDQQPRAARKARRARASGSRDGGVNAAPQAVHRSGRGAASRSTTFHSP